VGAYAPGVPGIYQGQDVTWPIITSSRQNCPTHSDGSTNTRLSLSYTPKDYKGLLGFGADILLMGQPLFEGEGSRTVKLLSRESQLVPEETSLVREWEGNIGGGRRAFSPRPGFRWTAP